MVKVFLIAFTSFLCIDMLWLGVIARGFYQRQIGGFLKTEVNWVAAFAFYLLFIAGLVFFVITPAIEKQSWRDAMLHGAFFGLVCYATYDLTNLAVAKNWPLTVTLVDLAWGGVLAASVSIITTIIVLKTA